MNLADLQEQYAILKVQLAEVNAAISVIVNSKNKKYTYSNVESSHSAETQSLADLIALRKDIKAEIASIENQLLGPFVKIKNYC